MSVIWTQVEKPSFSWSTLKINCMTSDIPPQKSVFKLDHDWGILIFSIQKLKPVDIYQYQDPVSRVMHDVSQETKMHKWRRKQKRLLDDGADPARRSIRGAANRRGHRIPRRSAEARRIHMRPSKKPYDSAEAKGDRAETHDLYRFMQILETGENERRSKRRPPWDPPESAWRRQRHGMVMWAAGFGPRIDIGLYTTTVYRGSPFEWAKLS